MDALHVLVRAFPAGFTYNEDRLDARRVFDSLTELGVVHSFEVEDGRAYQLSEEMAVALGVSAARKGALARRN